ncbi:hypothetical protein BpHYR1_015021 [Brachionus plicatilis]|uniref:Uncharacterized protein n=1 Tax=Brachionus plicatilis TaxID=10195 RepID=A0A3M7T4U8_BRAPC|nr:hypothetical protein BpHYR1_015021 [Brachionus plicatilis]
MFFFCNKSGASGPFLNFSKKRVFKKNEGNFKKGIEEIFFILYKNEENFKKGIDEFFFLIKNFID